MLDVGGSSTLHRFFISVRCFTFCSLVFHTDPTIFIRSNYRRPLLSAGLLFEVLTICSLLILMVMVDYEDITKIIVFVIRVSSMRAACGPRDAFVRPANISNFLQILNNFSLFSELF